jgi:hypothetical protein
MILRGKLVGTCIGLATALLFGTALLSCGGDDDDTLSAGTGGGETTVTGSGGSYTGSSFGGSKGGVTGGTTASTSTDRTGNTAGRWGRLDGGIFDRDSGSSATTGANRCTDADGGLHRGITTENCGPVGGQCVTCQSGQICDRETRVCVAATGDAG